MTALHFGVDAEAAGVMAASLEEATAEALEEAAAEALEGGQAVAAGAAVRRTARKEAARLEEAGRVSAVDTLQVIGSEQKRKEGGKKETVKATIYDKKNATYSMNSNS